MIRINEDSWRVRSTDIIAVSQPFVSLVKGTAHEEARPTPKVSPVNAA